MARFSHLKPPGQQVKTYKFSAVNSVCTKRVNNPAEHGGNLGLSPAIPRQHTLGVDGCGQVCAVVLSSHAGTTVVHPQSTALIIRTIQNPHQAVMTTIADNNQGVTREISL